VEGRAAAMQTDEELREHFEIERRLADRLRDAPTKDERRLLYGEVYRQRSELIPHHPLVLRSSDDVVQMEAARNQVRLLKPFVDRNSRFCELGAGDAAVARAIAPHVRSSLALDVTDALAPRSDPSIGFEFRVFDGFDLEVEADSLDLVYSNDVAEHLHADDLLDQTRAVLRALRTGGRYVCVTPNRLSGPHDVSRHFSDEPLGFHLHEYTATELGGLFMGAGFARVRFVLSLRGMRFSPLLPVAGMRPFEGVLERLPRSLRHSLGRALAAVKVVAIK
jgi:SAM-dependent methyltransferase